MADKIAQVNEFTREQFFPLFVKYLHETQNFVVTEERKPDFIRFSMLPMVKEGIIELRPTGKGFDVYVAMTFGSMYKLSGILSWGTMGKMYKDSVVNIILKAISRAKSELTSSIVAQPISNIKYCIKCGMSMPTDAVYCPKCGQKQP